jgi:hypothetical protein
MLPGYAMWYNRKESQPVSLCLCCFSSSGWWNKKAKHVNKELTFFAGQRKGENSVNKHPISIEHTLQENSLFLFKYLRT